MNTTATILKAARDLIAKPENWTQGASARTKSGDEVSIGSSDAECFCANGAIFRVAETPRMGFRAQKFLKAELPESRRFVSTFNDSHAHSEVLALFSKAIKAAEGEQS